MHRWDGNRTGIFHPARGDQHGEQATDYQSSEHLLHHRRLLAKTASKGRTNPTENTPDLCESTLKTICISIVSSYSSRMKFALLLGNSIEEVDRLREDGGHLCDSCHLARCLSRTRWKERTGGNETFHILASDDYRAGGMIEVG